MSRTGRRGEDVSARRSELLNLTKYLLGKEFPVPIKPNGMGAFAQGKQLALTKAAAAPREPLGIIITPREHVTNDEFRCPDSVRAMFSLLCARCPSFASPAKDRKPPNHGAAGSICCLALAAPPPSHTAAPKLSVHAP